VTAMFPDSGVPPADAKNSTDPVTSFCNELWYSTSRCQPRFDPAAANAVLSELTALINSGMVNYDCRYLDQVQLAVRYLVQRGIMKGTPLVGPNNYIGNWLDPPLTFYNDYLTLLVIPNLSNTGPVTAAISNQRVVEVRRNDNQQMQAGDWIGNLPYLIMYWNGIFYNVATLKSQIPVLIDPQGNVDIWIRPDGNDDTGDGGENSPTRAFRTIEGAWLKVAARYASFPQFSLNMRLGIPGVYEGAAIGPFGGRVTISGDRGNFTNYRIMPKATGLANAHTCLTGGNVASFYINGITCVLTATQPFTGCGMRFVGNTFGILADCRIESQINNINNLMVSVSTGGKMALGGGNLYMDSQGNALTAFIHCYQGLVGGGLSGNSSETYHFLNGVLYLPEAATLRADNLSIQDFGACSFAVSNITGQKYLVSGNSILSMGGKAPPGSDPGEVITGGQFIP
jgi:hypothetical protein